MRSFVVVVFAPSLDDRLSLGQREELIVVEAFLTQPPVEALNERILVRLARPDEVELHAVAVGPGVHLVAGELGAIVATDSGHLALKLE